MAVEFAIERDGPEIDLLGHEALKGVDPKLIAKARRKAVARVTTKIVDRLESAGLLVVDAEVLNAISLVQQPERLPNFDFGNVVINPSYREVWVDDVPAKLTPAEWRVLIVLLRNDGRVVPKEKLLRLAWGHSYAEDDHLVRVNVARLRAKLEPNRRQGDPFSIIETVTGIGYFVAPLRKGPRR